MFKALFGKSDDVLERYQMSGEQTGVFTLALNGVEDPFDADPLWDRKYGGVSEIFEETSEDKDFRLQAALDGCRDMKFVRDDAGRFREVTPVFTDIVVWVPQAKWRADSQRGGRRIEALATNLAKLHHRSFRRSLPEHRQPVYTVMPDADMEEDGIAFQFGFGVFVPNETDHLVGEIRLRRKADADPVEIPKWSFWSGGQEKTRPVGIYEGQGALLLTPDQTGPVRAPIWFGSNQGNISVNLGAAESERVYASDTEITVTETTTPKTDEDPFQWVLKDSRAGSGDDAMLVVEVKFLEEPKTAKAPEPEPEPEPVPEPPVIKPAPAGKKGRKGEPAAPRLVAPDPATRPPARARADAPGAATPKSGLDRFFAANERTGAGDSTPLSTRFSLKLSGCALLRIDGDRRLPGLEEWVIWFDRYGQPIRADARRDDTGGALALAATAHSRDLYYRLPGEDGFKPVKVVPCSLVTEDGGYLDLIKSPAPEVYHGLLQLRPESSFPLSPQPLLLGRSDSASAANQPDLPMELLDHPHSLRWEDGTGPKGAKLNSLNLSRRHVQLRLVGGKLEVGVSEGRMPVYVLDTEYTLMKTLTPGEPATIMMEPDEYFIVGSYLLRFHQERHQTMLSSDATMLRRNPAPAA